MTKPPESFAAPPKFIDVEHVDGKIITINLDYLMMVTPNTDDTMTIAMSIPDHGDTGFFTSNVMYCRPIGLTIEQFILGLKGL